MRKMRRTARRNRLISLKIEKKETIVKRHPDMSRVKISKYRNTHNVTETFVPLTWNSSSSTRWGCAWNSTLPANRTPRIRLVCTVPLSVPACETWRWSICDMVANRWQKLSPRRSSFWPPATGMKYCVQWKKKPNVYNGPCVIF